MKEFVDTRSRNVVIKRMITLGLIADKSEILPSKRKKSRPNRPGNLSNDDSGSGSGSGSGSDSDSSTENRRSVKITVKSKKSSKSSSATPSKRAASQRTAPVALDINKVKDLINNMNEDAKDHLNWIIESLNDAADDYEEPDSDADDDEDNSVPLVPFLATQKEAIKTNEFENLLANIGLQKPLKEMVIMNVKMINEWKTFTIFFIFLCCKLGNLLANPGQYDCR